MLTTLDDEIQNAKNFMGVLVPSKIPNFSWGG
jgi:hypothetical protein